jgi:hypothetical protein
MFRNLPMKVLQSVSVKFSVIASRDPCTSVAPVVIAPVLCLVVLIWAFSLLLSQVKHLSVVFLFLKTTLHFIDLLDWFFSLCFIYFILIFVHPSTSFRFGSFLLF